MKILIDQSVIDQALEALTDGDHWEKQEAITTLRQAKEQAQKQEPVALCEVGLTRDTKGLCIVTVNGREAIRDNGYVISHFATLDWFATAQPPRQPLTILMITTAYEQGVGKGQQAYRRKEEIKSPYVEGECYEAWRLGYKEGKTQAKDIEAAVNNQPPRQPLTDEELYKVFPAIATYHEANKTLYRSIARAIEAAHGIKGEQHG